MSRRRGEPENRKTRQLAKEKISYFPIFPFPVSCSKRVGLFGGTFNPIHYGHLKMADEARKKFKLDIVFFIPNGNPPHKKKDLLPAKKRYQLVKNAIKENKYFKVLDIEVKKKKPSYTIDTVKKLIENQRTRDPILFFLIGQDAFEKLETWHKVDKLVKLVKFIVFPRGKKKIKPPKKIKNLRWEPLKTKPIDLSGKEVRKSFKNNSSDLESISSKNI